MLHGVNFGHPPPMINVKIVVSYASMDSVTLPIWLTFNNRQLQALTSMPFWTLLGFVTNKSSLNKKEKLIIFNI